MPLALLVVTVQRLRHGSDGDACWLLVFVAATTLLLMTAANEVVKVVLDDRIRYLMPLWPLTALLVGGRLWRLANRRSILATGMLALLLIYVARLTLATDFRYELGYFFRTDIRQPFPVVRQLVPASDLLIIELHASSCPIWMVFRQKRNTKKHLQIQVGSL